MSKKKPAKASGSTPPPASEAETETELTNDELEGDMPSTPALDDESLDSEAPPALGDELGVTGENPSLDDAPSTEEQPPASEETFPPDAPNADEPEVPTLKEWTDAGYEEANYYHRFGKNPTPNTKPAEAIPSRASRRGKKAFVVWPHGSLARDGVLHEPGSILMLSEQEAAGIPCVSPAEPELDDDDADDEE